MNIRRECVKENDAVLGAHRVFRMNDNVNMKIDFSRKRSQEGKELESNPFNFLAV